MVRMLKNLCLNVHGKGDYKEDDVRDRGDTWPSEIFVGLVWFRRICFGVEGEGTS